MDVDERRTPDHELGAPVAAGRDATIHDAGPGRVLRRTPTERDLQPEAEIMEHLRAQGYPVPQVFRVGPGEMVLERISGPTMLEDLEARPWRVRRHARVLASLHTRLHELPAPPGLRPHPVTGDAVLHQDLHPGNVICSPDGPVVIDWTNARQGAPAADIALSWVLMSSFELDQDPPAGSWPRRLVTRIERRATPLVRRRLVSTFLRSSGLEREARACLQATADQRLDDRNVRPGEAIAIQAMLDREHFG
ncbi:hypothetical protein BH10ACT1_BH10ACT1_12580 [soil metagenome]